jgi:hypothetical protein
LEFGGKFVEAHGCLPGYVKEALNESAIDRVVVKNEMIARRATPVVVILRSQGAQHSKRSFLTQPGWDKALRAACGVRLLVKGVAINFVAFLASHPAKPLSRPCGIYSALP